MLLYWNTGGYYVLDKCKDIEEGKEMFKWEMLPKDLIKILDGCFETDPNKRISMERLHELLKSTFENLDNLNKEELGELQATCQKYKESIEETMGSSSHSNEEEECKDDEGVKTSENEQSE